MENKIFEFMKNNEEYLKDFITRSTYHSNGLEGNTLTYGETYAILYNDNSITIQGKSPGEIHETINHKEALEVVFKYIEENQELNNQMIINLGKIINKNIKEIDGYRKVQVLIQAAEHIPPEPSKVQNLMYYFIDNYNNELVENNIFNKIAKYHYNFEQIHPFEDGNGRTGRILINYELLKNGYAPIVIERDNRAEYFDYLARKDINQLTKFFESLENKELERLKIFGYNS